MSKNRNRAALKCLIGKEYKIKFYKFEYNYCYICNKRAGSRFYDCHPTSFNCVGRHGNGKMIENHKARSYKSWKYNRKTKWK